ncbi:MAG: hypothetical protein ACKVP5_07800 [Aestuariivirga sp.]
MNKRRRKLHAAREHPEVAGLEASLHHSSGWPVLSIVDSPQTLELELINRTPQPVTAGPAHLNLVFRPGILTALEDIVLAPQSEAAWSLTIRPPKADELHRDVVWEFAGVDAFTLAPGESMAIRIDGVSADAAGGSRASRVQLHYFNFFLENGVEVAGTQLMHLPVLRRHEPVGLPATALRTGSTAVSGPFRAGFLNGPDLLNDGKTPNTLKLRIVNTTGRPIPLSNVDDAATRFYLSFRTGDENAEWGLLGSHNDHLDLAVDQDGWQVDNHTIRRTDPAPWERDQFLDLELTVYTAARTGDAQVIVTYENLPANDDGDLVLLAHLGPVVAGETGVSISGGLEVTGPIKSGANHPVITPATFKLGGDIGSFYPVVFEDLGWAQGEFRFEVFRADTHVDGQWRGSMMAKAVCHDDSYGNGSGYWSIEVRQSTASGKPTRYFVGGFESYPYASKHVLWLAGDTTYSWLANHEARIAPSDLGNPDAVSVDQPVPKKYAVKDAPDDRFSAEYISISESLGRDTSPVPRGAILMWSGSFDNIPLGWGLCNGALGTPDLRDRFIVAAGGTYEPGAQGGQDAVQLGVQQMPKHTHDGQVQGTGTHRHIIPVDHGTVAGLGWYSPNAIRASTSYFNESTWAEIDSWAYTSYGLAAPAPDGGEGEHSHTLWLDSTGGGQAHENRPPYYALCFIMKL